MNAGNSVTGWIRPAAVFFILFMTASTAFGYSWRPGQGTGNWEAYNVADISTGAGDAVISAGADPRGFTITIPSEEFGGARWVRLRLRSMDTLSSVVCVLTAGEDNAAYREENLVSGRTWRDYVFDFSDAAPRTARVDRITLVFKRSHRLEVSAIDAGSGPLTDVFYPRGLSHSDVNFSYPYRVFGVSLALVFSVIAALGMLGAAFLGKEKRKDLLMPGIIFLSLFTVYDLRTDIDALSDMTSTVGDYLSAPPGEKRFLWYEDMMDFASFIRGVVPQGAGQVRYFGDDDRFLYFRYLLYPLDLVHREDSPAKYNIFYGRDNAGVEGDRLIVDGRTMAAGGRMIPFDRNAFIYVRP